MMNNRYARAYTEVLEIIKYFPEDEYKRIPQEKIDFFEQSKDKNYEFTIDPNKDLSEQNISKEANAIIVVLYQDYFATEEQKKKINQILRMNELKAEQEKIEKYNPNELFKNKEEKKQQNLYNNTSLTEQKDSFFTKFKNFIFKLLHIN